MLADASLLSLLDDQLVDRLRADHRLYSCDQWRTRLLLAKGGQREDRCEELPAHLGGLGEVGDLELHGAREALLDFLRQIRQPVEDSGLLAMVGRREEFGEELLFERHVLPRLGDAGADACEL